MTPQRDGKSLPAVEVSHESCVSKPMYHITYGAWPCDLFVFLGYKGRLASCIKVFMYYSFKEKGIFKVGFSSQIVNGTTFLLDWKAKEGQTQ